jgi:hypothetical protein
MTPLLRILRCEAMGLSVSRDEFRQNLALKMNNESFLGDIQGLLRPEIIYDAHEACRLVESSLVELL